VVACLQALDGRREEGLVDQAAGAPLIAEVERSMEAAGAFWELT